MNWWGLLAGAGTVLGATSLGAAGVFALKEITKRTFAIIIAFCAGVMSFAVIEMIEQAQLPPEGGHRVALAGVLIGVGFFLLVDRLLPHAHLMLTGVQITDSKHKVAMLVGTITLHNIPEGFAVAAAFSDNPSLGWLITLSIGLQDIPEGLLVSAPIKSYGIHTKHSFAWGVFSGLVEAGAALVAFLCLGLIKSATPWALGFSAGAMGYVVLCELLPDALAAENRYVALGTAIGGFAFAYGFSVLIGF